MDVLQSPTPSPKTRICASGDRLRFILKTHRHHHPTDCTKISQSSPGWASGDWLLSSHHQCTGKTHRNRVKFTLVKDVGTLLAASEEIRRAKDDLQRTHETLQDQSRTSTTLTAPFHGCQSHKKVRRRLPYDRSECKRRKEVGTILIGIEQSLF